MPRIKSVAEQLEKLPHELVEPVLANLRMKDIIELLQYAGPNLKAAIEYDPAWRRVWPKEPAHAAQLKTIYFEVVKKNEKLFNWALSDRWTGWRAYNKPYPLELTADELRRTPLDQQSQNVLNSIVKVLVWLIYHTKSLKVLRSYYKDPAPRIWKGTPRFRRGEYLIGTKQVDTEDLKSFFDCYWIAQTSLNNAKAEQISTLARLYVEHPTRLKTPIAPQSRRQNVNHVHEQLQLAERRVLRAQDLGRSSRSSTYCRSIFRFKHAGLVPYNWCLALWLKVLELCPALFDEQGSDEILPQIQAQSPHAPPSSEIRNCIHIAKLGLLYCYRKCPESFCNGNGSSNSADPLARFRYCVHYGTATSRPRMSTKRIEYDSNGSSAYFLTDMKFHVDAGPKDSREIEWLTAFVRAVAWMEEAFPDIVCKILEDRASCVETIEAQEKVRRESRSHTRKDKRKAVKAAKREKSRKYFRSRT